MASHLGTQMLACVCDPFFTLPGQDIKEELTKSMSGYGYLIIREC